MVTENGENLNKEDNEEEFQHEIVSFVEYLEKSKLPINDLQVMYKLSGDEESLEILNKIEAEIIRAQRKKALGHIKAHIDYLNNTYKNKKYTNVDVIKYNITEGKIYAIDLEHLIFDMSGKSITEQFIMFMKEKKEIFKNAHDILLKLLANRKAYISAINETVKKIDVLGLDKTLVGCKFTYSCGDNERYLDVTFNYHNKTVHKIGKVDTLEDVPQINEEFLESLNHYYMQKVEAINKAIINKKIKDVREFVSQQYMVKSSYWPKYSPYRRIRLSVKEKATLDDPMYDFENGWINVHFDVNNGELVKQFKIDLDKAISKIIQFEKAYNVKHINNVNIGSYYLKFAAEKEINGILYRAFDCKGYYDSSARYHVFKDGARVEGNERKRAIKLLGLGRKNWNNKGES